MAVGYTIQRPPYSGHAEVCCAAEEMGGLPPGERRSECPCPAGDNGLEVACDRQRGPRAPGLPTLPTRPCCLLPALLASPGSSEP